MLKSCVDGSPYSVPLSVQGRCGCAPLDCVPVECAGYEEEDVVVPETLLVGRLTTYEQQRFCRGFNTIVAFRVHDFCHKLMFYICTSFLNTNTEKLNNSLWAGLNYAALPFLEKMESATPTGWACL